MDAARTEKLRQLSLATGHQFSNSILALESLCAASAITQDGNRLLAMTGDVLLKLVMVEDMTERGLSRGNIQSIVSRVVSNAHLYVIGQRNGIDRLIIKSNVQRYDPPSPITVATTVEAILAAVWNDTGKDLDAVGNVMRSLGLWPEA